MKTYAIVWLSGVMAGLVLVERWRRTGARSVPAAERAATDVATASTASTAADEPGGKPKMSVLIVTGAKADARRARQMLGQVMPWGTTSDPSLAQLRRWSPAD